MGSSRRRPTAPAPSLWPEPNDPPPPSRGARGGGGVARGVDLSGDAHGQSSSGPASTRRSLKGAALLVCALSMAVLLAQQAEKTGKDWREVLPGTGGGGGGLGGRGGGGDGFEESELVEEEEWTGLVPVCCEAALAGATHQEVVDACVRTHAPPLSPPLGSAHVTLITHAPRASPGYAAHTLSLVAMYARAHGHALSVESPRQASHQARPGRHAEYDKVGYLWQWMQEAVKAEAAAGGGDREDRWAFWVDTDAAVVDLGRDALGRLADAADLGTSLLVGGETRAGGGEAAGDLACSTGVLGLRVSHWTLRFLEAWWKHPEALKGKADSATLALMFRANYLGVRKHLRAVEMHAINGGLGTFLRPSQQPVLHLFGTSDDLKLQVFRSLARAVCVARAGEAANATLALEEGEGEGEGGAGAGARAAAALAATVRTLPAQWDRVVVSTALDAHLSVIKGVAAKAANTKRGWRMMYQMAESLMKNQELCKPEGRERCLAHWGGYEEALNIFMNLDMAMLASEHAPNERVNLLDKMAGMYEALGKHAKAVKKWQECDRILGGALPEKRDHELDLWRARLLMKQVPPLRHLDKQEQVFEVLLQSMELFVSVHGVEHDEFGDYLNQVMVQAAYLGRMEEAAQYKELLKKQMEGQRRRQAKREADKAAGVEAAGPPPAGPLPPSIAKTFELNDNIEASL